MLLHTKSVTKTNRLLFFAQLLLTILLKPVFQYKILSSLCKQSVTVIGLLNVIDIQSIIAHKRNFIDILKSLWRNRHDPRRRKNVEGHKRVHMSVKYSNRLKQIRTVETRLSDLSNYKKYFLVLLHSFDIILFIVTETFYLKRC